MAKKQEKLTLRDRKMIKLALVAATGDTVAARQLAECMSASDPKLLQLMNRKKK